MLLGLINAFDMPARQAFLSEMTNTKEDLANAIALNSSMFNGARLVGPAVAGGLLAVVGAGVCFLANAASYLAVLAAPRWHASAAAAGWRRSGYPCSAA